MEFDQPYNGANVDWNFPSPGATPTTGAFGHQVFQTPKADTPTHFQDAFSTPQIQAFTTPRVAQYTSMNSVERPQTAGEETGHDFGAHVSSFGQTHQGRDMLPPGQTQPGYVMASPHFAAARHGAMQQVIGGSLGDTQMQTPPPTRGASTKRTVPSAPVTFATPSTIASRRFVTPQQHPATAGPNVSQTQHTPVQFPQLQFSPDVYQFSHMGPASAPIMPGSRVFWGDSASPTAPLPSNSLDDPFAPQSANWASAAARQSMQAASFGSSMNSFAMREPFDRPASAAPLPSSVGPSPGQSLPVGVNPSLLYSSPVMPLARSNSRANMGKAQAALDGQKHDFGFSARARADTLMSPDGGDGSALASLRRSNTIGSTRPQGARPLSIATDVLSRSTGGPPPPRTVSPLKRSGRHSLGPISEIIPVHRASVILTVDENGRARTERRPATDETPPSLSVRDRYPALFDSDSSEDESDGTTHTPSRAGSFTFERRDERRSKAARLDPPVENLEGLHLPRSSSSASMRMGLTPSKAAVAAASQLRRQGSARKPPPPGRLVRRNTKTSPTGPPAAIDSYPMELPDSRPPPPPPHRQTPQQSAPQQTTPQHLTPSRAFASPGAFQSPPAFQTAALDAYNQRWNVMSFEQQQQQQQQQQQSAYPPPSLQHQHPGRLQTAFQPLPPPPAHAALASSPSAASSPIAPRRQIRCLCGDVNDRGLPLLQCRSCTQWLHVPCIGMPAIGLAPGAFTCFLCTRPPPSRYGPGAMQQG